MRSNLNQLTVQIKAQLKVMRL